MACKQYQGAGLIVSYIEFGLAALDTQRIESCEDRAKYFVWTTVVWMHIHGYFERKG